jgi:hypothetical protein
MSAITTLQALIDNSIYCVIGRLPIINEYTGILVIGKVA